MRGDNGGGGSASCEHGTGGRLGRSTRTLLSSDPRRPTIHQSPAGLIPVSVPRDLLGCREGVVEIRQDHGAGLVEGLNGKEKLSEQSHACRGGWWWEPRSGGVW